MSFFSKKLKEVKRTQIISRGLKLDEMIKDSILAELRKKFGDNIEIDVNMIQFHFLSKKDKEANFVALEHPSKEHAQKKIVVLTTSRSKTLKTFIK